MCRIMYQKEITHWNNYSSPGSSWVLQVTRVCFEGGGLACKIVRFEVLFRLLFGCVALVCCNSTFRFDLARQTPEKTLMHIPPYFMLSQVQTWTDS